VGIKARATLAAALVFLVAIVFATLAPAEELSLEAAKAAAAKGDTAMLIRYADAMRNGWAWGLLYIEAMELVDARTYSKANAEKKPLRKYIRCVQALRPEEIVPKALNIDAAKLDLNSPVETFYAAVGFTIGKLCPAPSLEIKSQQPQK
jgi:hypothetical protein